MDGTDYDPDEYIGTLTDLRRVNRYLGGQRALASHLFPMIARLGRSTIRLLDIGTGSADIPARIVDWGRARGISVNFVVLDLNAMAAAESARQSAGYPEIKVVRADAFELPFADDSFDFVIASLFLHHFETSEAARIMLGIWRVAREGFIINDLRRHPLAYYAIKTLTRLFTQNRLIRHDAALSVLRGFTEKDLAEISSAAGLPVAVSRNFPYRVIMTGRKNTRENER